MAHTALILAAGRGTRMHSRLAKVLHPLCGMPMVQWVVQAAQEAGCDVHLVVGHQAEAVKAATAGLPASLQDPPQGTGDAVRCAAAALPPEGTVIVLAGDVPMVRAETLTALLGGHGEALCTVLTALMPELEAQTSGYGRIVREGEAVTRIVEAANATETERQIREFNTGIYAFDVGWLVQEVLPNLQLHPPKDEYYLTDAVEAAAKAGRLQAVLHEDPSELSGINDRAQLADAEARLQSRLLLRWMREGVTVRDPASTYVDHSVTLSADVTLGPSVVLQGNTTVAEGVEIGSHCVLRDTRVEAGARVEPGSICTGAHIGPGCVVGPMARLREGAVLQEGSRVGNFVEIKKTTLGEGAKANHLSYLGDATVGAGANVGAGTITCNYDGHGKHPTHIAAGAFIGSNTALVAPVSVGAGAIIGAGSCVTEDVPDNALAVSRARQKTLPGKAASIHERNAERARAAKEDS